MCGFATPEVVCCFATPEVVCGFATPEVARCFTVDCRFATPEVARGFATLTRSCAAPPPDRAGTKAVRLTLRRRACISSSSESLSQLGGAADTHVPFLGGAASAVPLLSAPLLGGVAVLGGVAALGDITDARRLLAMRSPRSSGASSSSLPLPLQLQLQLLTLMLPGETDVWPGVQSAMTSTRPS